MKTMIFHSISALTATPAKTDGSDTVICVCKTVVICTLLDMVGLHGLGHEGLMCSSRFSKDGGDGDSSGCLFDVSHDLTARWDENVDGDFRLSKWKNRNRL